MHGYPRDGAARRDGGSFLNRKTVDGIGMTSRRTRARLIDRLREKGISNQRVLQAISDTPRHLFVDEALASRAYEDAALPIGYQQTISQPFVVAMMTQSLMENVNKHTRVLEIGTGCGYQTMVLSRLVNLVYSIERIGALQIAARDRLYDLKVRNVYLKHGDGFSGWPENGPYSGILLTAAPETVPESLYEQLLVGGAMILPEGDRHTQRLITIKRTNDGYERHEGAWVNFVPMVSGKL
jgi:protein-L-isoaspartate(D-aspartate) O-methyltransferase